MSNSDFGQPNYGQPAWPNTPDPDLTQPAYPADNSYTQPAAFPDADTTQPVEQHWDAPHVGWEGQSQGWDVPMAEEPPRGNFGRVMVALAVGSLVAVGLGVYGSVHEPTGEALNLAGFSDGLHAKAWLATAAFALVIVQLLSALAMWGRLPGVQ